MSVKASSWAWEQDVGDALAKLVLMAIADRADDDGLAWPKLAEITRKTGLHRSTVINKISFLEEERFLEKEHRFTESGRQTSSWLRLRFQQTELHLGGRVAACDPGVAENDPPPSGRVAQGDGEGRFCTTGRVVPERPSGVVSARPLEPSEEPSLEPPEETKARERAPSPPPGEVHVDDELDLGPRLVELDDRMPDLRPKEQQLRDHLGSHADVVDLLSLRLSSELWCASVWGWYGPEGIYTDLDMAPVPAASRGDALAAALYAVLQELEDDARGIHQKFLRGCVRTVVDERWRQKRPFFTADEERRREEARRAVLRTGGDPQELGSILRGPPPSPASIEREESRVERQLREDREWFASLSPERQAAIRLSAQTRAIDRFGHVPTSALIRDLILDDEIRETRKVEEEVAKEPGPDSAQTPESRRDALKRQVEAIARTA